MAGRPEGFTFHKVRFIDKSTMPPDDKLLVNGAIKPLPPDHWCDGCGFDTRLPDRMVCPFVEGSCVRIPGSLENPSPEILHSRIRYDRIYTDAHVEVFEDVRSNQ